MNTNNISYLKIAGCALGTLFIAALFYRIVQYCLRAGRPKAKNSTSQHSVNSNQTPIGARSVNEDNSQFPVVIKFKPQPELCKKSCLPVATRTGTSLRPQQMTFEQITNSLRDILESTGNLYLFTQQCELMELSIVVSKQQLQSPCCTNDIKKALKKIYDHLEFYQNDNNRDALSGCSAMLKNSGIMRFIKQYKAA